MKTLVHQHIKGAGSLYFLNKYLRIKCITHNHCHFLEFYATNTQQARCFLNFLCTINCWDLIMHLNSKCLLMSFVFCFVFKRRI